MWAKQKSILPAKMYQRGFTIVELLIVIVVIGILAAIVVVAYTGVQDRAREANLVAAVDAYEKALALYLTDNGTYPSTSTVCLGSGYTDHTGDGKPDCRWGSGNVNPDATFNSKLAAYVPQPPAVSSSYTTNSGSGNVSGVYFMEDSLGKLDGNTQTYWLVYAIKGKTSCPVGPNPLLTSTYPVFTSQPSGVSETWSNGAICWIPLPMPA